jgi:hypothetical protein
MWGRHRKLRVIVAAAGLSLCAAPPAWPAPERVIEAIWRVQHIDFRYDSPRYQYTCDALKNKVRAILRTIGAHEALIIDASCSGDLIVQQLRARISLATPVEATAENVRAATTFDARDELVAKLGDKRLPTAADLERFPASWRRVSLPRDGRLHLEAGDCELLKSIRKQVLPRLGVDVRDWGRRCSLEATRVQAGYEVEALLPIRKPLVGETGA